MSEKAGKGRIRTRLEASREAGHAAFSAYLTAGDPELAATEKYVEALARAGADVIELGVPYSDPVADGPTNIQAAGRALKNGVSLRDVLGLSRRLRDRGVDVPLVLFTYFNPIHRLGEAKFAEATRASGLDAVLIVDLPPEEGEGLRAALHGAGVGTVFLASPTTTPERLARIAGASSEFVYYVSRLGVTGVRSDVSATLGDETKRLRAAITLPVAVGFGISTAAQATQVAAVADGVIVGSAIVKIIEDHPRPEAAAAKIEEFARGLAQAIHQPRKGT